MAGDANGVSDVFVHERGGTPQQQSECVAPSTTASATTASGASYESDTWTNEDVEVTLSAQDNEGGSEHKGHPLLGNRSGDISRRPSSPTEPA